MNKKLVSKFINCLSFRGVELEYCSGKKEDFENLPITYDYTENSLILTAELSEYYLSFIYSLVGENAVSIKSVATPKHDNVSDKIRKIISLKGFLKLSKDALVVKQNFIESKVVNRSNDEKTSISVDFLSVYEKSNIESAISFLANTRCKFYTEVVYKNLSSGTTFNLVTVIPYTYEGVIEGEEWTVYGNISTVDALKEHLKDIPFSEDFEKPIGWSTWDYYATSATENDVIKNVDFIANNPYLKDKVKYIAIDDGWEQREGDWVSGMRYPSGLKHTVDYVKDKGYEAGIWISPTRLHMQSATVCRRYDFLIRKEHGDPIMDFDMYILDPTHPDGESFLRDTFKYLKDAGFTFYKLDFVNFLLKCDRFYDKTAGHYDVLRRLFQICRECVGNKSHIMGCSLPYAVGKGVADSRRAGLDIHNHFKHIIKCLEIGWYQFPSNEKLHRLDMDYLIVRGEETANDDKSNVLNSAEGFFKANPCDDFRWRDGAEFNYNEAKCWCAVVLLSGSSIFLGDNLEKLNEKGLSLIYTTLKYADFHSAEPILKGEEGLPEVWKKQGSIYCFNFSKRAKDYTVELENGTYFDIFENKEYQVTNNKLSLTINPHDCVTLYKK